MLKASCITATHIYVGTFAGRCHVTPCRLAGT